MVLGEVRAAVATAALRLLEDGLVRGTSGNVSARAGELVAVTPTGVDYRGLRPADVAVVDRDGRERGRVADVIPGAAHDLLAVELADGGRALVPAVAALVTVELQARRVLVDALPGLLDAGHGEG